MKALWSDPGPAGATRARPAFCLRLWSCVGRWVEGAFKKTHMKTKTPRIDPALRELIGLTLVAGGGCALALVQNDLLFAAIFGAACATDGSLS
jgi:hypothetical protein